MVRLTSCLSVAFVIQAAALALDGISDDLRKRRRAELEIDSANPLIGKMKYLVSTHQGNARLALCGFSDCGNEGMRVFAFPQGTNRRSSSMKWKLRFAPSLPQENVQIIMPSHDGRESMQLGICGESMCDGKSHGVQAFPESAGVYQWAMEKNYSYASGTVVRFRSVKHEDCYLGACGAQSCEGTEGFGLHCYEPDEWGLTKRDVHWTVVPAESPESWDDFLAAPVELPIGEQTELPEEMQHEIDMLNASEHKTPEAARGYRNDLQNDFPEDMEYEMLNNSREEMLHGSQQNGHEGAQSFLVSGRGSISRAG